MTDQTIETVRKYFHSRITGQIHSVQAPASYSGVGSTVLYDSEEECRSALDAARTYIDASSAERGLPYCAPDPGDTTDDADGSEMAGCQMCGKDIGEDGVCHWDSPHGSISVAFTCSRECADLLEQKRSADGVLRIEQDAALEHEFLVDDGDRYQGDGIDAVQYVTSEGITLRLPARLGVEYRHDRLCYEVMLETTDASLTVSVEVGAWLSMCRRMTGDPDQENDPDVRPAPGAETYSGQPFQTDSDSFGDWDLLYADRDGEGADGPVVVPARFGVGYDSRRHTYQAIAEDAEGQAIILWIDDDDLVAMCGRMLGY